MISKRWIARLFVLALVVALGGVALAGKGVNPAIQGPRLNDFQYDFAHPYGKYMAPLFYKVIPLRQPSEPNGTASFANSTTSTAAVQQPAADATPIPNASQSRVTMGGPMFVGGGGAGMSADRRASARALRSELRDVNDALGL